LWGGERRISEAIIAYKKSVQLDSQNAPTHFRLGVAYRKRYDSDLRLPSDFQLAVNQWKGALDRNPNQYIWRRRIQQYGPRLEKPYSFYDWVNTARREILARGKTPAHLTVEPGGAEFAEPAESFLNAVVSQEEPDPTGRIYRDQDELIRAEITTVPPYVSPGASMRFHIVFRPDLRKKAHWNNEVDDLALWINPPEGWEVESRHLTVPRPPQQLSQEDRQIELEAKSPANAKPGPVTIPSYALYYVCEDITGICMYRRQDVSLEVEVR